MQGALLEDQPITHTVMKAIPFSQPSWLRLRGSIHSPSDDPTAKRSCHLAPKKPCQIAANLTGGLREMQGRRDTDREIRARFDRQASATKQRPLPWSLVILMRKTVFFFVSFHRRAMQAWVLFLVSIERGTPMP
ncbi:MAG: hypothetical protein ACLQIB_38475, partial [Isosphaeraceae bacterium]